MTISQLFGATMVAGPVAAAAAAAGAGGAAAAPVAVAISRNVQPSRRKLPTETPAPDSPPSLPRAA